MVAEGCAGTYELIATKTRQRVGVGAKITSKLDGDEHVLRDGSPPHKSDSEGFVYVVGGTHGMGLRFYPSVFGLKWRLIR